MIDKASLTLNSDREPLPCKVCGLGTTGRLTTRCNGHTALCEPTCLSCAVVAVARLFQLKLHLTLDT